MDGLKFKEISKLHIKSGFIEAGYVEGDPVDTVFLKLARTKLKHMTLLMTPDEAAGIIWALSGVILDTFMPECKDGKKKKRSK